MYSTPKLAFISNIAAPYELKFLPALSKYFEIKYFYHSHVGTWRPSWWKIELPEQAEKVKFQIFRRGGRYLGIGLWTQLSSFQPDIVIADSFFNPSTFLAYLWSRSNKTSFFIRTETLRRKGYFLSKESLRARFLRLIYKRDNLSGILAVHKDAVNQIESLFPHLSGKIHILRTPVDIDNNFAHKIRVKRTGYRYLFANNLTKNYGALKVLEIFRQIHKKYPESTMKMNAVGELRKSVELFIIENNLTSAISFLDEIRSWDDLHTIYQNSDILLFPAIHSNGNQSIEEAMASGMGIIISNRILNDRDKVSANGGFVVEPETEYFLSAVESYIQNPQLFAEHSEVNRDALRWRLNKQTAKDYHELLKVFLPQ